MSRAPVSTDVAVPVATTAPVARLSDCSTNEAAASVIVVRTSPRLTPSRSATKARVWSKPSEAEEPKPPIWLAICWDTTVMVPTTSVTNAVTDRPAAA